MAIHWRQGVDGLPKSKRMLVAILAADVAGYSRLMEANEQATHERLMQLRAEIIDPKIDTHNGRLIKNTGDGFLAIFNSAHDAYKCAERMQLELSASTALDTSDRRIQFRMGVHV